MKRNEERNAIFAVIITWLFLLIYGIFALSSCSTGEELYKKANKKGFFVECLTDTVKVVDQIILGNDTIYQVRDSIIIRQNTQYEPKWMVKFDNKRFKDSLNAINKANKINLRTLKEQNDYSLDSLNKVHQNEQKRLKNELSKAKHESKSSIFWTWVGKRWYWWCIITFVLGMYTVYRWRKIVALFKDRI